MNANLTPSEQWRLHGQLNATTTERLLDLADAHQELDKNWAVSALNEVHANLPKEDAFTAIKGDLLDLAKRTRGATRAALQQLHAAVEALESLQHSDADHAHEQLNAVQKSLDAFPATWN